MTVVGNSRAIHRRNAAVPVEYRRGANQDGRMRAGLMSWFVPRFARRDRSPLKRRAPGSRRAAFEALEPRYAPATLGLGIRVLDDNGGVPGAPRTTPLTVGEIFWVQVMAEDQRAN